MNNLDPKPAIAVGITTALTLSNVTVFLQFTAVVLTILYTVRRWYIMEKKNNEASK
jgi:hypothetical protein